MKLLALTILLASQSLFAASFTCISEKDKYIIEANYDEERAIIYSMVYKSGQAIVAEFTNLPFTQTRSSVLFSSRKVITLDVDFKHERARYLTITRNEIGGMVSAIGNGAFIPKNSIFSPEYQLSCQFED